MGARGRLCFSLLCSLDVQEKGQAAEDPSKGSTEWEGTRVQRDVGEEGSAEAVTKAAPDQRAPGNRQEVPLVGSLLPRPRWRSVISFTHSPWMSICGW